jgi:hypothetical protein
MIEVRTLPTRALLGIAEADCRAESACLIRRSKDGLTKGKGPACSGCANAEPPKVRMGDVIRRQTAKTAIVVHAEACPKIV